MIRKTINIGRLVDIPHRTDAVVKPRTAVINVRLRPKKFASHPVIGRMTAFATRYEVKAHDASSTLAERLPAM